MKSLKYFYFLLLIVVANVNRLSAQSSDIPLHHPVYSILPFTRVAHSLSLSSVKPVSRMKINKWVHDSVSSDYLPVLRYYTNLELLKNPREKPLFGGFYKNGASTWSKEEEDFSININPVWQIGFGHEKFTSKSHTIFTNSRGLEVWGYIDKVGFYTNFTENQAILPAYVKIVSDSTGVLPFEGFWKETSAYGVDFLRANGHVDFSLSKHIQFQTGFGKHHMGYGQRSLFLSDFSNAYPYFKITTEFWRVKYTQLLAELTADVYTYPGGTLGSSQYPKKWLSTHYLELSLGKKVTLGLFEAIINGSPDSLGGTALKLSYINPIIFYRAIEQQDGSSDNALLGLEMKYMPMPFILMHGQFLLDELVVSEVTAQNNWWGNKYALQMGIKLLEPGIKNLQIQAEYNMARPFTYSHESRYTSYTHYLLPLAHPLGANFTECLLRSDYQVSSKWWISLQSFYAEVGTDKNSLVSLGNDPNVAYTLRQGDYKHKLLQGNKSKIAFGQVIVSYQLFHNLFMDVQGIYRNEKFEQHIENRETRLLMLSIRWNTALRTNIF